MTVDEALRAGAAALPERVGIPDPRREASWLLAAAWGVTEVWLRLHLEERLPNEVEARYRSWLERRAAGEPAHHLTGTCTFWGREFGVSPAVLVPRPETELLVQAALELDLPDGAQILDIGTGSGCIALTLAAERSSWWVAAIDRSPAALAVAATNIRAHGVEVFLLLGDLGTSLRGPFDVLAANLPYVPSREIGGLSAEVQHDPILALDGGEDGLDMVRRLIADLSRLLTPNGWVLLELGEGQADEVSRAAAGAGLREMRRVVDLAGCDRVLVLQNY